MLGELLPLAVGVAVSPVPVIAVILVLLPPAGGTSRGFLAGWLAGIVAAVVVFLLVACTADLGSSADPSALAAWLRLLLVLAVLALGVPPAWTVPGRVAWRVHTGPGTAGSDQRRYASRRCSTSRT